MTRSSLATLLVALGTSCSEPPARPASVEAACMDAGRRTGELECLHRVSSRQDCSAVSVPLEAVDQVRSAKYMVPIRLDARLPPLLLNGFRHQLHYEFLARVFPDLFPSLTPKQYLRLLFDATEREYLVGAVTEYRTTQGRTSFGFSISGDPGQPGVVTCEDVRRVHAELRPRLAVTELSVVPSDKPQSTSFLNCGVPFMDPSTLEYEAYHRAAAFGTVRRFRGGELALAMERAEVAFQDIVVVDEAPSDIQTVVSGVVTGTRQGPLSHVAVRSASRGTPNCYLKDAYAYLEDWAGELVRLECAPAGLLVREASPEHARAYWEQLRPDPVTIPEPDREFSQLVALDGLAVQSLEERLLAVARFGAKGRNLAWLRQSMAPELTPRGFLVPIAHYLRFVEENDWQVDLGAGIETQTFADTLSAWHEDPTFVTDAGVRRQRLLSLQQAFMAAPCDAELMSAIRDKMTETFGGAAITARFRSSSNAEDGAFFNGAGLYDSYSGCLADDDDDDERGPSRCDPGEANERTACRALRRVWASLHNPKAYDERAFYGIDPASVAMGVLVNERSEAELANMVVFSGNPGGARDDDRYLVSAQIGELPVVTTSPGMWPEQTLLTVRDGHVSLIERLSGSSEVSDGETVLADAELEQLGTELSRLVDIYPHDVEPPPGRAFLLDTEWKVMPDGSLRIKQVRPFLK